MAKKQKSGGFFLENSRLFKNASAGIGFLVATLAVVAGLRQFRNQPQPVEENTEIVVDRSEAMDTDFEGKHKLATVLETAQKIIGQVAASDNLALRQFGGPCKGDNTQLRVSFAQNNSKRLQDSLKSLVATGQASLAHAVIEAMGDYNDRARFEHVSKRIVVITGSDDVCMGKGAAEAILDRIQQNKKHGFDIELNYRFIGIGLTAPQRENLNQIASATGGRAFFADHRPDLERLLRRVIVLEPVVKDTESMVTSLNAGVENLNGALAAIGRRDYSAAEASLQGARAESAKSELPFDSLGKGQRKEQFQELYEVASQNRGIHSRLVSLAETMLAEAKANDTAGYSASQAEYIKFSSDFNQNVSRISRILEQF